ncbi:MAG: hypothetical protein ABSE62_09645 [Chthoniobacteraceae bacterium]
MKAIIAIVSIAASIQAFAADATFSKDSSRVYLIHFETNGGLVDVNLGKKTFRKIDLTASIGEPIQGVTLSNAGFVILATKDAVWSYDPSKGGCAKVCDAPQGISLDDIAYDPKTGQILATGYPDQGDQSILRLPKGETTFVNVRSRYGTEMSHPVFAADGTLFFASSGDLWSGAISTDDETLVACRCVPIAFLVDENTSPASTGAQDIAAGQTSIYVNDARLGGSGWGSIIRFHRPKALATLDDGDWSIPVEGMGPKDFQAILSSVEQLAGDPAEFLCGSGDGSLIFFANPLAPSDEVSLVKDDGKPRSIEIKGLADSLK